jgi:sugar phosphate isomerase/epimerase
MPKIGIGTWAFGAYAEDPLDFDVMLERLSSVGFDGVDFGAFPPHPDPSTVVGGAQRRALAELFDSHGLEIGAVAAGFGETSFLQTDDPAPYLDALSQNLEFARDLGARRLMINARDTPETPYEVGLKIASERLMSTWREATRRAESFGVALTWEFEPCWAFNEPAFIIDFAHELAGPWFGVLYDTAHGHTVSEVGARHVGGPRPLPGGQVEFLERLAGTINHVHLLDSDGSLHAAGTSSARTTVHVPFGQGDVNFQTLIPALAEAAGSAEWWTVDLCFWPDAWGATADAKSFVDRVLTAQAPV